MDSRLAVGLHTEGLTRKGALELKGRMIRGRLGQERIPFGGKYDAYCQLLQLSPFRLRVVLYSKKKEDGKNN